MANLYRVREKTTAAGDTTVFKMSTDNVSGLSTVATSGSYNDLSDKPVLTPAVIAQVLGLTETQLAQLVALAKITTVDTTTVTLNSNLKTQSYDTN